MGRSISSLTEHNTDATGCPYCHTVHAFCEHPLCACFSGFAGWLLLRIISAHSLCCWPYSAQDSSIIRPELPAIARALPAEKCYNSFPNRRREERV